MKGRLITVSVNLGNSFGFAYMGESAELMTSFMASCLLYEVMLSLFGPSLKIRSIVW